MISSFRVGIKSDGIYKAGGLNRLARVIGYKSRIHPAWPLRQILVGKQPFPIERLTKLAEFINHEMPDILRHEVPSARLANENNEIALKRYGFFISSN